jgi:N-acetylneuraminic acid mutarotase
MRLRIQRFSLSQTRSLVIALGVSILFSCGYSSGVISIDSPFATNRELRLRDASISLNRNPTLIALETENAFKGGPIRSHTSTLLQDGKLLILGGMEASPSNASTLYDPTDRSTTTPATAMPTARSYHTSTLLPDGRVIVMGGLSPTATTLNSAQIYSPLTEAWTNATNMTSARQLHTANLISGNRVLVTGGISSSELSSTQIYNISSNTWSSGPSLPIAQSNHTATTLHDGNVLIVGKNRASLFNTTTNTLSNMAAPTYARGSLSPHTATLLSNGEVLIVGGDAAETADAERFSPLAANWSLAGKPIYHRTNHTATLLPDGKVLVVGGLTGTPAQATSSVEIYDPDSNSWSATASLKRPRHSHSATLLPSGKVLVYGGQDNESLGGVSQEDIVQIYDPDTSSWENDDPVSLGRSNPSVHPQPDGKILIAGGEGSGGFALHSSEVFDPSDDSWHRSTSLSRPRSQHASVTLANGEILLAGGWDTGKFGISRCETRSVSNATWIKRASMGAARYGHTLTRLTDGKAILVGGNSSSTLSSASIYDPSTDSWSVTTSMSQARFGHVAALLPDGRVFVGGGRNGSTYLSSSEIYDPSTATWSNGPSLVTNRYYASLTPLMNGDLLLAGGQISPSAATTNVLLIDSTNLSTSLRAALSQARAFHSATVMKDGKILVSGGATTGGSDSLSSLEVYDPFADTWSTLPSLDGPRHHHWSVSLSDGRVLIGGIGATPLTHYPLALAPQASHSLLSFYDPIQIEPMDCQTPYQFQLVSGTGTLYPNGRYVPNQFQPEIAIIRATSKDGCHAEFTATTL